MASTPRARAANVDRIRVAEEAADALRQALAAHDVTFPSLRLDLVTCAMTEPNPLLDLGRCNVETALRLAAALRATTPPTHGRADGRPVVAG
ncbi:hypothetical protein GL263_10350 [Streptomyces durbertensis]|uniref:Uncharacterized protein n=1 Tax=Streptomyces durbertensis TaxID=2448886 RepID=A0ABR6EFB7_9ACTN|nr:hypothetical protein [Streptomyces durbertensis]MBB1243953.1 hypothetical protein [Streptomyces durbertensis]